MTDIKKQLKDAGYKYHPNCYITFSNSLKKKYSYKGDNCIGMYQKGYGKFYVEGNVEYKYHIDCWVYDYEKDYEGYRYNFEIRIETKHGWLHITTAQWFFCDNKWHKARNLKQLEETFESIYYNINGEYEGEIQQLQDLNYENL